jgi:hypothetical protein
MSDKAKLYGKVVRLPKNGDALAFMEKIKTKNNIWYVMVEKQVLNEQANTEETQLHMVKFKEGDGVNANQFVAELKAYYIKTFEGQQKLKALIEKIKVVGNEKFSVIQNIPNVKIGDKKLVTRITEDLIKLLA